MELKNSRKMKGYKDLKKSYEEKGYYLLENFLHEDELPDFDKLSVESLEKVYEKGKGAIRSIYGFHESNYFKNWLMDKRPINEIVSALLGENVYLHQSKVNIKNANRDSVWPYHRDFPFWNIFDNVPVNKMLNIVIYLDDVTEDSGGLKLIPGSHKEFLVSELDSVNVDYSIEGSASSDLLFGFEDNELEYFKKKYGVVDTLGKKGSMLLFNPDILHGSSNSFSNFSRKIIILTFNSCDNLPLKESERPEYLSSSNYKPLEWK